MRKLRVLVACEFSGTVRRAFEARGHDAWSCDLLPDENGSNRHICGDVRDILNDGWDLLVAHPPCTRLCNSGVRWLSVPPPGKSHDDMQRELREGAELFSDLWNAPIDRIAVENPVMHKHAKALIRNYQEPAQSVQPWQFGHGETKRTCLWLKNLPTLKPTDIVEGREARVHRMPPGPDRWKERSRFFSGIAAAMADQWGGYADLTPVEQMALRGRPDRVKQLVIEVCRRRGARIDETLGPGRWHDGFKARAEIAYRLRTEFNGEGAPPSWPQIGRWIGRDHTSAYNAACRHAVSIGQRYVGNVDAKMTTDRKSHQARDWQLNNAGKVTA